MDETLIGGRYRLCELIAEGGSSSVYRVQDEALDVERALKVLGRGPAQDPEVRERFGREARLLARLRHPHLVAVHDRGEWGNRPYIILDLLPGGSLEELVNREVRPDLPTCVRLVDGLLEALAAVHEEGVVHRDVKPANVVIDSRGQACLTDFGIARVAETSAHPTATGSRLGTFAYMSPEQLTDPRNVDARSDLFSVGAVLFALLVGDAPFGLVDSERRGALLARVPAEIRDVVARATQSNPAGRYGSAREMQAAVRAVVQPAETRRPLFGAALVAVLLAGIAGSAGLLLSRSPSPVPATAELPAVAPTSPDPVPVDPVEPASAASDDPGAVSRLLSPAPARGPQPPDSPLVLADARAARKVAAPVATEAPPTEAAAPAWLSVNSIPWSEVSIDGRPRGRTPISRLEVAAGTHSVRLVSSSDGGHADRTLTLAPGEDGLFCWDYREGSDCKR